MRWRETCWRYIYNLFFLPTVWQVKETLPASTLHTQVVFFFLLFFAASCEQNQEEEEEESR